MCIPYSDIHPPRTLGGRATLDRAKLRKQAAKFPRKISSSLPPPPARSAPRPKPRARRARPGPRPPSGRPPPALRVRVRGRRAWLRPLSGNRLVAGGSVAGARVSPPRASRSPRSRVSSSGKPEVS